ncbi:arylsulfotransferase family protein [Roseibium salinum]|uniref:arylsulfotransferase family protein n=1 Tax=Roseibium salinum TaxID=1604349 RepID=UPI003614B23F
MQGVSVNRGAAVQEGLTLYTTGDKPSAYLIDAEGNVVHEWSRPFSTVWSPGKGDLQQPQPDSHVYFRHAHAFPNGDLLAIYEGVGDTPYGYGMVKLNRDSEVLWSYFGRTHHQFSVAPDGKIYALTHAFMDDQTDRLGHLHNPRLEDFLVVLSPEGEELEKFRLVTALMDSRYRHMLYTVSGFALGDPLHANSVKYIDADLARNFAPGKEGQILMSFREATGLAILDPATGEITWATRGPWLGQHDPDILPNGNILLFDNYGNFSDTAGVSRVLEFDPVTMNIVWRYQGSDETPLESRIRSDQQRLPNGNTLITESNGGRIIEVNRAGETVWEYVNPVRGGPNGDLIPIISWSERLPDTYFDPAIADSASTAETTPNRRKSL